MQQNLHTVSRSINSQAAQIRNSLSEIEKSLNKIASNEDIKNKKEKNKKAGNKQGIQFQIQSKIGASIIVVRAVIAVLVVVVVYNLLIKANNTELQQDSEAISLQVEKYFLPFERMVKQLALDEDVQTILTTTKAGQRMRYTRRY